MTVETPLPIEEVPFEARWLLTWLEQEGFAETKPRSFARAKRLLTAMESGTWAT